MVPLKLGSLLMSVAHDTSGGRRRHVMKSEGHAELTQLSLDPAVRELAPTYPYGGVVLPVLRRDGPTPCHIVELAPPPHVRGWPGPSGLD